jgi:hypothetical protein
MRMAESLLARAGETGTKLGGSIAVGVVVGAAAAILVGGLIGAHETSTSVVQVGHSSVSTNR